MHSGVGGTRIQLIVADTAVGLMTVRPTADRRPNRADRPRSTVGPKRTVNREFFLQRRLKIRYEYYEYDNVIYQKKPFRMRSKYVGTVYLIIVIGYFKHFNGHLVTIGYYLVKI